ncbi:hypothetical protein VINI7043_20338 [Vibrio nigripulchritudo ATCC 27043]|uniref:hypothetical protein n=1 Tax=Vibrio nigripulchritudo TaxID=28173 RepID=UPI00021C348E|nr:hypothetical protein [Vibrio nigripulchritudo]EGU59853.1 hypothetical protein VINI7043_20338 [Vibrio nigripulchritudo ATCC 27043]
MKVTKYLMFTSALIFSTNSFAEDGLTLGDLLSNTKSLTEENEVLKSWRAFTKLNFSVDSEGQPQSKVTYLNNLDQSVAIISTPEGSIEMLETPNVTLFKGAGQTGVYGYGQCGEMDAPTPVQMRFYSSLLQFLLSEASAVKPESINQTLKVSREEKQVDAQVWIGEPIVLDVGEDMPIGDYIEVQAPWGVSGDIRRNTADLGFNFNYFYSYEGGKDEVKLKGTWENTPQRTDGYDHESMDNWLVCVDEAYLESVNKVGPKNVGKLVKLVNP